MCQYYKNYFIYMSCTEPGLHFFSISVDGHKARSCGKGPHERYIVVAEDCPHCSY